MGTYTLPDFPTASVPTEAQFKMLTTGPKRRG